MAINVQERICTRISNINHWLVCLYWCLGAVCMRFRCMMHPVCMRCTRVHDDGRRFLQRESENYISPLVLLFFLFSYFFYCWEVIIKRARTICKNIFNGPNECNWPDNKYVVCFFGFFLSFSLSLSLSLCATRSWIYLLFVCFVTGVQLKDFLLGHYKFLCLKF